MTLEESLETLRKKSRSYVSDAAREVMSRSTADLRGSGIMSRVTAIGAQAPDFSLENTHGEVISSASLRTEAPLVVTFYRGFW